MKEEQESFDEQPELRRPEEAIEDLSPEDAESEKVTGGVFEMKTN